MKRTTKELKEKAFEINPQIFERYNTETASLNKILDKNRKGMLALLQKALDEKLFPKKEMEHYRSVLSKDKNLSEQLRIEVMGVWIDKVSDSSISKEYKRLNDEIGKAREKYLLFIAEIEQEHRFKLTVKNPLFNNFNLPIEGVECIIVDQLGGNGHPEDHTFLDTRNVSFFDKNNAESFIKNNFLFLQINLTYDKSEILNLCDDVITKAQNITGKNKRARTTVVEEMFDSLFKFYYPAEKSKRDTLDKIQEKLRSIGVEIDSETLDKKYLPGLKKRCGIKDIRQLKGGQSV